MKRLTLCIALMFLTGCNALKGTGLFSILTAEPKFSGLTLIFILPGQSNNIGIGFGGELGPNTQVLVYGFDGKLAIASDPLHNPVGCIYPGLVNPQGGYGVGPGRFFADVLSSRYRQTRIVLVPCAKGATSITEWVPGTPLYDIMVQRTREAITKTGGAVAGVVFWQGESDYIDLDHATHWADRFTAMVSGYRRTFGEIPFIYTQIADLNNHPLRPTLRANQATVKLSKCVMVNTEGEPMQYVNGEHFTTGGYAAMGKRFAGAFIDNFEPKNGFAVGTTRD